IQIVNRQEIINLDEEFAESSTSTNNKKRSNIESQKSKKRLRIDFN
ncbi:862_t:CDS:1, partial [Scutellospora calospora]